MTRRTLCIRAILMPGSGYCRAVFTIARALIDRGIDVRFDPTMPAVEILGEIPDWVRERLRMPLERELTFQFTLPAIPPPKDRPTIVYSMWESTRLAPRCVESLNRALEVWVPSRFNAISFTASGVDVPLSIVPLGVDTDVFTPAPRSRRDGTFVVGMAGRMLHGGCRKGFVEGIVAWRKAFSGDSRAELHIKCSHDDPVPDFGDPRITISRYHLPDDQLCEWYRGLDVLLHPSKGEGWGFHLLESLACGVPVVSPCWSGEADFLTPLVCYQLRGQLRPGQEVYAGQGAWYWPDESSIVERLREARDDPNRAQRSAFARSIAEEYAWPRIVDDFERRLNEFEVR